MLASTIQAQLAAFDPADDGEARKSLELTYALLAFCSDPCARGHYHPGHITTTGIVIHPDGGHILLVHHARLERWLLPGGHVEPADLSLAASGAREVLEETGVTVIPDGPLVNVDVHPIPPKRGEPLHLHHDLIFSFQAATAETVRSEESREVVWCAVTGFDRYALPDPIRRAAARALNIQAYSKHPGQPTA